MIPARIAYSLGALGLTLMGQTFGTYLAFYYLDHLGLAAPAFALAGLVFSIWDAVNDPLFGYLSDRTRTPWGRRRPWFFLGIPLLLLAFYLTFGVPEPLRQGEALFWYCLGVILFFETFAALTWVNHAALFPELFQGQKERAQANRVFQHGLHEHNTFIQMGNYFLVAESLFVVAYAGLLSSGQSSVTAGIQPTNILLIARVLAFFGLLLTAVWIYVNQRQWGIFRHLQERARELVPEYKVTYETRPKRRVFATVLVAYFVPISIGIMWAVFLFIPQ